LENPSASDPSPESRHRDLEALNLRRRPSLAREFFFFLKENRKWWLLPILLVFAALGALAALATTGATPFIYTLL
jgi:hypothetical protein